MKKLSGIQKEFQTLKTFINKYNWEKNYPSKIDDWKKIGKNNPKIALNILYTKDLKNTSSLYIYNSTLEKAIILLIIPNKEKEG